MTQFKLTFCPIEGQITFEGFPDGHCEVALPSMRPINVEVMSENTKWADNKIVGHTK